MKIKKNQHYVPKFYLRNFSADSKNLNIYNIKDKKFVSGPITHQCSKSYFYSKNKSVEDLISKLESGEAPAINKLIRERKISSLNEEDYFKIREFISIMHGRTLTKKKETEKMVDNFTEKIFKPVFRADSSSKGLSDEDIAKIKVKWPTLHLLGITYGFYGWILLLDLISSLIINNTKREFIISDNPIVFYNRAFHSLKGVSMRGYASPGLTIFCPLNPNLMLMLFDAHYYKVKMSKINKVKITEKDVKEINKLQLFSGYDSVYYKTKKQKEYIEEIHKSVGEIPDKPFVESKFDKIESTEGKIKEVFHTSKGKIPFELNLRFMKSKNIGKGKIGFVRNPELYEAFEKMSKLEDF